MRPLRDAESKTSVHLRRTCPPSKKALATGHPSRLCGSGRAFAGQSGICVVAKPPDEVQRSFFMPQIEVTTRRGREGPQPSSPAIKRATTTVSDPHAHHISAREVRRRVRGSRLPTPAGHQRRQDSHPAVAAQLAGSDSRGKEELTEKFRGPL